MNNGNSGNSLRSEYEKFSTLAERVALLILAGLSVEIVAVFILRKSLLESLLTIAATTLIAVGVWGEIVLERRAKKASDGIVAEANATAAQAIERAATLEKEAADARARTAEIERLTEWRHISAEQMNKLVRAILNKVPKIVVIEYELDPEANMYSQQLAALFENADVKDISRHETHMSIDDKPLFGVFVGGVPKTHAFVVRDAFAEVGIKVVIDDAILATPPRRSSSEITSYLRMYVGHKPR